MWESRCHFLAFAQAALQCFQAVPAGSPAIRTELENGLVSG